MSERRSTVGVILSWIFGLLMLLILLGLANLIVPHIGNPTLTALLDFINDSVWLIILISIVFFFSDLFRSFRFPFNFPYPIINAWGASMVVTFAFSILAFLNTLMEMGLVKSIMKLEALVQTIVFVLALIVGYVQVFTGIGRRSKESVTHDRPFWEEETEKHKVVQSWSEVNNEFRGLVFDFLRSLRRGLRKK